MAHASELSGHRPLAAGFTAALRFEPGRSAACFHFLSTCRVASDYRTASLLFCVLLAGGYAAMKQRKLYLLPGPGGYCRHAPLVGQRVSLEYAHIGQEQIRMAEHIRTTPLRLRPEEHRDHTIAGDLLMALGRCYSALYTWGQYNLYVFKVLYAQLSC